MSIPHPHEPESPASRQKIRTRRTRRQTRSIRPFRALGALADDEEGAVTAEYAIIIMAAVAFAGVLVAIVRSPEIRAMLVGLVESALGAAG